MRQVTIPGADAPRTRPVVLVALALLLGLLGSLLSVPQAARADESGVLFSLLNQARNGEGRSSLGRMAALDAVALEWATSMAAAGELSHNPSLRNQIPGGWSFIGENVARGYPSGSTMHQGWWNSSGHRANMLGDFTDVGIAFLSAGGSTWGVQVFARYGASLPPYSAPAPEAPAPAPAPAPAQPAPAPAQPAPAPPAPVRPAPAAAASPDPQPSVIDPAPSRAPTLLPSPRATPTPEPTPASASPEPTRSETSPAGPGESAPDDGARFAWLWVVALLAVVALGLIPLARRRART